MNIHNFTIRGRIPSKKNNRRNFGRTSLPSLRFGEWKQEAGVQLLKYKDLNIQNISEIQMDFYFPDNKRTDLDNKSSSVLDILVDMGIIEDDRWQITGRIMLYPMGIAKKNPRVEIFIKAENDRA